jgi:hypothetical protein
MIPVCSRLDTPTTSDIAIREGFSFDEYFHPERALLSHSFKINNRC